MSRNLRSLRDSKIKECIIPRNKIIGGKPLWGVKNIVLPKSSRPHNPKIGRQSSPFQIILNEALNSCKKLHLLMQKLMLNKSK